MENNKMTRNNKKVFNIAFLILSVVMSCFITYRLYTFFSWIYALSFFLVIHLCIIGVFCLTRKRFKTGLGIHILLSILLVIGCCFIFKLNSFTNRIFDNSESEMIMLVVKKDSSLTQQDDFTNKRIGFIDSDIETTAFAEEMLSEAKKDSYEKIDYASYKELYEALMKQDVDMMVYTSFIEQKLAEEDIESANEVKMVMQKKRTLQSVESKDVNISKDPFNILISGVDLTSYDINEKGSSDVNIIMTINPKTKNVIMQTIPRDTWAKLACVSGGHTKLTYAGAFGGLDCSIKTIENYMGIDINYYAKINFQGVIDLVDALGGISVNSDASFCSTYCFNEGINYLNGKQALTFSRVRKVFSEGDVARGRHQMEVINAVIRKFNESPSLSNVNALLGAVENNFTTNLTEGDIGNGLSLLMNMGSKLSNIEAHTMKGELVWKDDEVTNEYLYYFIPNEGEVDLFRQRIQDVMEGK